MKNPNLSLVELYAMLSPSEKRSITMDLDAMGSKALRQRLLWDSLDSQQGLSEAQWMRDLMELHALKPAAMQIAKQQLHETVEAALLRAQLPNDAILEIYQHLGSARVLRNKGLVEAALRYLEKAEALARETEEAELLLHILDLAQTISLDQQDGKLQALEDAGIENELAKLRQDSAATLDLKLGIRKLARHLRNRKEAAMPEAQLQRHAQQARHVLAAETGQGRAAIVACTLLGAVSSVAGEKSEALAYRLRLHGIFQSKPSRMALRMAIYSANLYNITATLAFQGRWLEAKSYLQELENLPQQHSEKFNPYFLAFHETRSLNISMYIGLYFNAHESCLQAYNSFKFRNLKLGGLQEFELGCHFAAAVMTYEEGHLKTSRKLIRFCLEEFPASFRRDIRLLLKCLDLMTLVVADEGEYVQYKLSNLLREYRDEQSKMALWLEWAKYAVKLYAMPAGDREALWQDWQGKLAASNWRIGLFDIVLPRGMEWLQRHFGLSGLVV